MNNSQSHRELTLRGMIIGALITIVFTASNIYLGLKVGMTISSAIPAAVISMTILGLFSNRNILENTSVQTQASAAGTLSSVIFVLPAMLMLGYWQNFHFLQTTLICLGGGILGVVFSIPLRHVMVVKSHLPYPEGIAAAEILKVGCDNSDEGKKNNREGFKDIITGGIIAAIVNIFTNGFKLISDSASLWFSKGNSIFQIPIGFSLALFSAGYLVGISAAIAILIGIFIAWGIAVPILTINSDHSLGSLDTIGMQLWASDIRFIGAGTLAIASIWTLLTLLKPLISGLIYSFRNKNSLKGNENEPIPRTEQDLSPKTLIILSVATFVILLGTFSRFVFAGGLSTGISLVLIFTCVILAFLVGFFIASACGYMAGLVGSSSSPISGIGIIAVSVISLVLLFLSQFINNAHDENTREFLTALVIFTTSVIISTAAIANDNLQDLKTGHLVGATPWKQEIALLIGCVIGAMIIAPVLELLYHAYGFAGYLPRENMDPEQVLHAPQATLMTTIVKAIFSDVLEWKMIIIGIFVGISCIIIDSILLAKKCNFRLPALAVAMGIYLPPTLNMPLVVGGILSWLVLRTAAMKAKDKQSESKVNRKATLIASGLIVGESLIGVLIAIIIIISINNGGSSSPLSLEPYFSPIFGSYTKIVSQLLGLTVFFSVCAYFYKRAVSALKIHN